MFCALPMCFKDREALTIYNGFAMCEECYEVALECPSELTPMQMLEVISLVDDAPEEQTITEAVFEVCRLKGWLGPSFSLLDVTNL